MGNAFLDDPDVRLMLAIKADVPGAFEELVSRHAPALFAFLYRHTGNAEDAEDLAQEAFARVYRARTGYEPTARFKTWLLAIATNVSLNRRRYERHRPHVSLDRDGNEARDSARPLEPEDTRNPGPADGLERTEVQERVRTAVQRLPDNQRLAVSLLRFEGLAYREIADALQISVQAVKSLLNRAKENLRVMLQREIKDYLAAPAAPVPGDG